MRKLFECNADIKVWVKFNSGMNIKLKGRLQRMSGKWGGCGFKISDVLGRGRGWFVKFVRPKISEKFEIFSEYIS